MVTTPSAQLIAFRSRKGNNPAESAQLLASLAAAHNGANLAYALHYNNFVGLKRSDAAAHDLELELNTARVTAVADALPFPVTCEADMGSNYSGADDLQILLGARRGENSPQDRAGIDAHDPRATWWIEIDGEFFEDSRLTADTDPAVVAAWIADRATHHHSPATLAHA